MIDRLFKVAKSYVYDIVENMVEKGEEKYGFDSDDTEEEFKRWKEEMNRKYDGQYKYGGSGTRSQSSKNKEAKHFKDLELEPTTDFTKIKKHYRKMVMKYHPDRFPNDAKKRKSAEKIAARLNTAYDYFEKKYTNKK